MKTRIYYHHTDCGGVVYYARYLDFLEEARTEYMDKRGAAVEELKKQGIFFVVARQEIDYKAPAFYGDILEIDTRVSGMGAAKAIFECEIKNQQGKLIANAKTVLVFVDKAFKPMAIPQEVRDKLK